VPNVTNGVGRWIKVTFDVDNGASGYDVKFYESATDGSYSQIGSTVTGGATTSIYDGTALLTMGAEQDDLTEMAFEGTIYNAFVLDGIGGTVQLDADFTAEAAGTPGDDRNNVDTFTEDSANAATVTVVSKISGWTVSGDAAAVWTIVDDATELKAAGLEYVVYDGRVLKCDNSGGAALSYIQGDATCGNTNDHNCSLYARGSGDVEFRLSGTAGSADTVTASYIRYDQTLTPSGSGNNPRITVDAGDTIYIVLPQLEESPVATEVIPNATNASLTRSADDLEVAFTDTYSAADGITVQIEFDPVDDDLDVGTQQYLVLGDDKNSTMSLSFRKDDADYKAKLVNDGTTAYNLTFSESITAGQSNQITIRLNPSTNKLEAYVGDVAETGVSVTLPSDGESWASDEITIGKNSYAKIYKVRVAKGVYTPAQMELLAIDPVG